MTELLLYQKRLQYVTQRLNGDTYDSVNLTIDQEEKIVALEESIKKFLEEHQEANSSLLLLNDNLNQCKEQDQGHQLRFDELKAHERTIEESIELNEKKLREIESEIMQLEKKKTLYLSDTPEFPIPKLLNISLPESKPVICVTVDGEIKVDEPAQAVKQRRSQKLPK